MCLIKLNLLPPSEKEDLAFREKQRWVLLYGGAILGITLIFIVLLVANWLSVFIQLKNANTDLLNLQQGEKGLDIKTQEENFQNLNRILETIDRYQSNQKRFSLILIELAQITPANIHLESIDIKKDQMTLSGFAPERKNLLEFEKVLKESHFFNSVENPLSNLIKAENITFYLKLTLNPKFLSYD